MGILRLIRIWIWIDSWMKRSSAVRRARATLGLREALEICGWMADGTTVGSQCLILLRQGGCFKGLSRLLLVPATTKVHGTGD